jgi:excisionase family DNA binding protein
VTVDEAARHLGLTVDAVRKRVQRGQIAYEKDIAGRVRIILDEGETLQDESPDTTGQVAGAHADLIEELRDRVHYLERVLEDEREARTEEHRRHDTLMAQLMQRIPQLEASPEASEASEAAEEQQGGGGPHPDAPGAQEGVQRPWWRRMFGN